MIVNRIAAYFPQATKPIVAGVDVAARDQYLPGMALPIPPTITRDFVQAQGLSLRAVYDRYLAGQHKPSTQRNYRLTLRRWEEFLQARQVALARVGGHVPPELVVPRQSCGTTLAANEQRSGTTCEPSCVVLDVAKPAIHAV